MPAGDQNDELSALSGKSVRIEKLGHVYEGKLQGRSHIGVISGKPPTPAQPWLLVGKGREWHFFANDGWQITLL
jgi:hypothetical protein